MADELKMLEELVPDLLATVVQRYEIIRQIRWKAPVGRRSLTTSLHLSERTLRTECDFLKSNGLIETSRSGMSLTEKGQELYIVLESCIDEFSGMKEIERQLKDVLNIDRCYVLSGDCDKDENVFDAFGNTLMGILDESLPDGQNVLAVMGGTTMAKIAQTFGNLESKKRQNTFVPARGGIGESLDIQANSVSAKMAEKSGGKHLPLYVPEQVQQETYELLIQEPGIHQVLTLIDQSNCVIHSVGRAIYMAARRKMPEEVILRLKQMDAVAESFGYFFNSQGEIVYKLPRIGLQLKQLREIPYVYCVAGGKLRAQAICAYMKNAPHQTWLITDESCANEILKGVTL